MKLQLETLIVRNILSGAFKSEFKQFFLYKKQPDLFLLLHLNSVHIMLQVIKTKYFSLPLFNNFASQRCNFSLLTTNIF